MARAAVNTAPSTRNRPGCPSYRWPFVVGAEGAGGIAVVVGAVIVLGLVFLYVLARNRQPALDLFHRLSGRWPTLQRHGGGLLESFLAGLGVLTDGWLFARFLFWMAFNWAQAIMNYTLIMLGFFPQTQLLGHVRAGRGRLWSARSHRCRARSAPLTARSRGR